MDTNFGGGAWHVELAVTLGCECACRPAWPEGENVIAP